ncbi:smr domain-containing protein [Hirsutella rhossiliensis]|uniref:Smr domain-containing protein n=1 Tax=Hirsutella rhossiliensis TaxID=111463 RepID=A0A9P8MQG9_9HYPO|nr:smr domain-containing protein [Hirsutella rhossiliensis]KAH0958604.1 smr domain-containing protein [Hirsutella rhossiliensis]
MAVEAEPDLVQHLVDSFHTLLDEALIVAIANDYNLQDPVAYDAAFETLRGLSQSVPSEEATGFNASGIPVHDEESDETKDESGTSTTNSRPTSQAHVTEPSSTDASSSIAPEPQTDIPRLTSFDNDSEESKILSLQSMFAELSAYDVSHSLKNAKGDFQAALDDLLNKQYLKSTGQEIKGIDGFFQADDAPLSKSKRKRKKKNQGNRANPDASPSLDESPGFDDGQHEIEYIAERFGIRSDEVSGIYRKTQRSGGATVVELLNQYISHGVESKDDAGKQHADGLTRKYRYVPGKYMPTIVHVAGSIPQFADDLAALLNKHFSRQSRGQKLELGYRLTPLPQEDIEGGAWQLATAKPARKLPTGQKDLGQVLETANNLHQAKRDTLETAAQLHRRGAANPLYRQAASFYTDRARDQARQAQQATSAAADLLVQQQTTPSSVDLHGVLVHDGVRIALQKTRDWWNGLGEFRVRKAKEEGFTVITGLGRHSAGGVSQMRQAVVAALLQDGWKLQVETGKFVVSGRR